MTTADWALAISVISAFVSFAGFVWNVWAKFIYPKPRVQVSFSQMFLIGEGWEDGPETLCMTVSNHGPSDVTIRCAVARKRRRGLFRKPKDIGMLNPYRSYPYDLESDGPFSGGLPKKLGVGEEFSLYFPVSRDWFEKEDLADFGVNDTFNRLHWTSRKNVRTTRASVLSGDNS